jgi:hypothetical protein
MERNFTWSATDPDLYLLGRIYSVLGIRPRHTGLPGQAFCTACWDHCTPMRCTPMRCTPMRCTPMGFSYPWARCWAFVNFERKKNGFWAEFPIPRRILAFSAGEDEAFNSKTESEETSRHCAVRHTPRHGNQSRRRIKRTNPEATSSARGPFVNPTVPIKTLTDRPL